MMLRCNRAVVLALTLAAQHAARAVAQTPTQPAAPADTTKLHNESNATRLFFAPTGRTLDAGRGYIAVHEVFFPLVAYGLTDRLTVAAGMSLIPAVNIKDQIYYFSPKLGVVRSARFNAALGLLIIRPPGDADICTGNNNPDGTCKRLHDLGVAYGAGTWGSLDASVTAGLGFGFINRSFSSDPFIVLGGNKRVSKKIALITENWIVPAVHNEPALVSFGVRFFGEALTVDFAAATPVGGDSSFIVPYLDFAFHF